MTGTVTVTEARNILGTVAGTMSDQQISMTLASMNWMAQNYLEIFKQSLTDGSKSYMFNAGSA